jgi:predicted metal-dependent phosphoesterase TrpH
MIIDFHVHSKFSFDCFLEPARILDLARAHGIDGLAVTDHDTMAGVDEFRRRADGLTIVAGEEITTADGDIVGLFLTEPLPKGLTTLEALDAIRRQGGLAVIVHPFKWPHTLRRASDLKRFDAIEVFNARNNIPLPWVPNARALKASVSLGLAVVAGSDTHEGFEMGRARTHFDFSPRDATDERIKEDILKRRVRVSGEEVALPAEIASHFSRLIRGKRR